MLFSTSFKRHENLFTCSLGNFTVSKSILYCRSSITILLWMSYEGYLCMFYQEFLCITFGLSIITKQRQKIMKVIIIIKKIKSRNHSLWLITDYTSAYTQRGKLSQSFLVSKSFPSLALIAYSFSFKALMSHCWNDLRFLKTYHGDKTFAGIKVIWGAGCTCENISI